MSEVGKNGNGNSNGNGSHDPFARGVWIITAALGYPNVLAMIHGTDLPDGPSEEQLRSDFAECSGLGVTLSRKYVLADLQFPVHERPTKENPEGRVYPTRMATFSTHEKLLDLEHPFESDVVLHSISWLSSMHPENVARLRQSVKNIDAQVERDRVLTKPKIATPSSAGLR